MLAARGLKVTAVEPNDAMRANGIKRTAEFADVRWHEGTGEATGQAAQAFDAVTFEFVQCLRQAGSAAGDGPHSEAAWLVRLHVESPPA